jgi:hypothetical protein
MSFRTFEHRTGTGKLHGLFFPALGIELQHSGVDLLRRIIPELEYAAEMNEASGLQAAGTVVKLVVRVLEMER